ncbi:hypothetical protein BIW11_09089 [Tropilaelaps mercedesae]|uniref:Uncharacterized protein n=1 Tax=Tropilaelaps mercedesae TaxID=418985 RepID=A0A1V9XM39_9ACAR|nr:hypothetical protein BIW11_09089 [Tropilaelaps mercedesae]
MPGGAICQVSYFGDQAMQKSGELRNRATSRRREQRESLSRFFWTNPQRRVRKSLSKQLHGIPSIPAIARGNVDTRYHYGQRFYGHFSRVRAWLWNSYKRIIRTVNLSNRICFTYTASPIRPVLCVQTNQNGAKSFSAYCGCVLYHLQIGSIEPDTSYRSQQRVVTGCGSTYETKMMDKC